jgi:hypothetical protein
MDVQKGSQYIELENIKCLSSRPFYLEIVNVLKSNATKSNFIKRTVFFAFL